MKMKVCYVTHPFTGDEENNRIKARELTAKLAKKYPDIIFLNPLDIFLSAELGELSYNHILIQCISLLNLCDMILISKEYKRNNEKSNGCTSEINYAKNNDITIIREEEVL